ncbi:MAG: MarR family transcriptional regulator [Faecalimonas sp.]|nr:MarR family transcriptional regulator [Faecalimonas sp.]
MKENELGVLNQYDVNANGTRKVRGAVLCDTKQGPFLLKELSFSESRVPKLYELYTFLAEQGYTDVDWIVKTKEGSLVSEAEDGTKYLLKKWFYGKECDCKREADVLDGVRNLACLHRVMECPSQTLQGEKEHPREDLAHVFFRRNRELKKVRSFMRGKVAKSEFELQFLQCFDGMYAWAERAVAQLSEFDCQGLFCASREKGCIVHGDYNYHNLLLANNRIATTGFEHFYTGVQMDDFYYFLRKTMEKNQWNIYLGHRMLEQYHRILPISDAALQYLAVCIAYPEKYWKLANSYNRSSKVWIPAKTVEKLELALRQTREKRKFLESIFSFRP